MNDITQIPPLPPPSGDVCSQCGAQVELKREFCPNCGARLLEKPRVSGAAMGGAASGCLLGCAGLGAVVFGLLGACAAAFSVSVGTSRPSELFSSSDWLFFTGLAVFWFVITGICVMWIRNIKRRK